MVGIAKDVKEFDRFTPPMIDRNDIVAAILPALDIDPMGCEAASERTGAIFEADLVLVIARPRCWIQCLDGRGVVGVDQRQASPSAGVRLGQGTRDQPLSTR
jgi:hypothetical protein